MQVKPLHFTPYEERLALVLGAAALFLGIFVKVTSELLENEVHGFDSFVLNHVVAMRRPWLNGIAVDLTALGSITLVALISAVVLCVLLLLKDRLAVWQLLLASLGAGVWTAITKDVIERARPENVTHLVQVSGFSYPSGHSLASASLYVTIAILAGRQLPTTKGRLVLFGIAVAIVALVGTSRIYLGVHYPSDVVSGISLGLAWALVLAGCFSMIERRA